MSRSRRGGFDLRLPAAERSLLRALPAQLDALLGAVPEDGAPPETLRRLFPVAYTRDPIAEAAYLASAGSHLADERRAALAVLASTADASHLTDEEADAWLGALNDIRLVLGTSLGVEEEIADVPEDDPRYGDWVAYSYLSYLEGELVEALVAGLPPPRPGADDEAPDDPWGDPPGGLRWDGTERPRR